MLACWMSLLLHILYVHHEISDRTPEPLAHSGWNQSPSQTVHIAAADALRRSMAIDSRLGIATIDYYSASELLSSYQLASHREA